MKEEREQDPREEVAVDGDDMDASAAVSVDESVAEGEGEGEGEGNGDAPREVEQLRGELEALSDRHLRLAAEFDNYRKRNERERQTLATRHQADLVSAMLDVLDDLERVGDTPGATAEAVAEGVRLVEKKMRASLESAGLTEVEAEGQPFDPAVMEALMTVPTDDPEQDDHVADVFQRGYRFRDVLVRPARVRVSKHEEGE